MDDMRDADIPFGLLYSSFISAHAKVGLTVLHPTFFFPHLLLCSNLKFKLGDAVGALQLLKEMQADETVVPDIRAYTAVRCLGPRHSLAAFFSSLCARTHLSRPTPQTMDACIKADNPNLALAICADMKRSGLEPDSVV